MSKTIKGLIAKEYSGRLAGIENAMVISVRGLKGTATTNLRGKLRKKKIKVQVVRNALAKQAFKGTPLASLESLLTGPSAIAFGGSSVVEVAREIVALMKDFPGIELRGAILDGQVFSGDKGVKELATYPTREEGLAKVVTLVVSPGRNVLGQIHGPGRSVAGLVKAIEGKLEKGETIARKAG